MKINKKLIQDFKSTKKGISKLLAVTKYWKVDETNEFINITGDLLGNIIIGYGENRVNSLWDKNLNRELTHFIGNIQTKEIKHIVNFSETIHSIDNFKHIKKIEEICEKQDTWVKVFLQINIDNTKDGGINIEKIPEYIAAIDESDNISLVGFSAIGKAEFTEEEKIEEFKLLKRLRSKYIPHGLISAGTSRDYKIALEQEIDIIRVGKSLIED